jgi:tRNA-specific 2-thiouridylase
VVKPGAVLDESGEHVGDHEGQHRFTIGQRRGVGVALGRPLYVVEKDVRANTVTLGPRHALLVRTCIVHEANWLIDAPAPGVWLAALGRYRSNGHLVPVRVRVLGATPPGPSGRAGAFEVEFADPQEAVAPGQALVLYDADTPDAVAGGGWIASAAR